MELVLLTRRKSLALACASTLLPTGGALAQARPGPDWLTVLRRHHDSIERAFKVLLEPDDDSWEKRGLQLRSLDQLLKAHSLAEESTIYPTMALTGLRQDAERLYQEEAHVKIEKVRLEMALRSRAGDKGWREAAVALHDAVLRHARRDEEQQLFPQLQAKLDAAGNERLTRAYNREFSRVLPAEPRR